MHAYEIPTPKWLSLSSGGVQTWVQLQLLGGKYRRRFFMECQGHFPNGTPPKKERLEPRNDGFQVRNLLASRHVFSGAMLVFRGVWDDDTSND